MDLLRKYLLTNVCRAPDGAGAVAATADGQVAPADPDVTVVEMPADTSDKLSVMRAARTLAQARVRLRQERQDGVRSDADASATRDKPEDQTTQTPAHVHPQSAVTAAPEAPAQESTAHPSSPEDGLRRTSASDAGEPQAPPGETESADPAALRQDGRERPDGLPPIEPPRSWTKEDKELFTSLPRETQERIAERERSREGDFNRRQQKATEESKALAAKLVEVEQVRQQYEGVLSLLLQGLQAQQAGQFGDIKTVEDLERLAREDGPRYLQWDLQQKKVAAVQQEAQAAQQRQQQEQRQQFAEYATRQDDLLTEKIPDMADKDKAAKLESAALAMLQEIGFSKEELAASYNGKLNLPIRDHRIRLLVVDALRWRDAQAKAKVAATKPVPPVQRPGPAQPKGAAQEAAVQTLSKQLETSSGMGAVRAAAKLVAARRAARR